MAAPFMAGVSHGLVEAGNDVFVLTPYSHKFNLKENGTYKVVTYKYIWPQRLHKLGYSEVLTNDMTLKPLMYLLSPLMIFFGILSLWRLVRQEKIDVINAHWILPNGFIASVVSLLTGVPTVSTLPGSDVYMASKNVLYKKMAQFAASVSSIITSNSPQLLEDLRKIVKLPKVSSKFRIVIYGVDPEVFTLTKAFRVKQLRFRLKIPADNLIVLGVGRLVAKKGFENMIKAAPAVLQKNKNVTFVIVGSGDQEEYLKKLSVKSNLQNNIRFTGSVNYRDLKYYYNLCDVFVLPSVRDEQGNLDDQSVAVVEAMSCGKPIVTTNFPGYRIVVKNGDNGFLTPERGVSEISQSLTRLVSNKNLRIKMGKRSRERVLNEFSWGAIGEEYTRIFKRVVKKMDENVMYSEEIEKILDVKERTRIAKQVLRVLTYHFRGKMKNKSCLDVGCSSGVISEYLSKSKSLKTVIGIDIDDHAIQVAQKKTREGLTFIKVESEKIPFPEERFDIVICNQVYNFVENPPYLLKEIYRVLKPGGICFFSARNKLAIMEPQYNLPLLSLFNKTWGTFYLKLMGRGRIFMGAKYMTYFKLHDLVRKFKIHDYTLEILRYPERFGFTKLRKYSRLARVLPLEIFRIFVPNYIWILEK